MQLAAFAFDYDGTLAQDGLINEHTYAALKRLKAAGAHLLLVSGRELPDLKRAFPGYEIFDAIVCENGALLFRPSSRQERLLADPPPAPLLAELKRQDVAPLSIGRSIIATWVPNETKVLAAIRDAGVEWQIIFNKGAVMCLPPGINKATGLLEALGDLELSSLNVIGIGDAENDQAMLAACGYSAAVANATERVKAEVDIVTTHDHGSGVEELISRFLDASSAQLTGSVRRHDIPIGQDEQGRSIALSPDSLVLIAGSSGGGKSRLTTLLIERLMEHGFQLCVVDAEGEYDHLAKLSSLGDPKTPPSLDEVAKLLQRPSNNVALNLLAVELEKRANFIAGLLAVVQKLYTSYARPHWLIIDEAHHSLHQAAQPSLLAARNNLPACVLVTAAPESLASEIRSAIQLVVAVGDAPDDTLVRCGSALGITPPAAIPRRGDFGDALFLERATGVVHRLQMGAPQQEHQRHVRKYAQGVLGPDKSFYFRGSRDALKLRAQNLTAFLELAEGVDEETWLFHLQRGDYSRWFREAVKDEQLAQEAELIEQVDPVSVTASRRAIRELVNKRYTAPGGDAS